MAENWRFYKNMYDYSSHALFKIPLLALRNDLLSRKLGEEIAIW